VVRAALALSLIVVAIPAAAAPGAFQLTGTAQCVSNAQVVVLQWTFSSGATSYDVIRDDGRLTTLSPFPAGYPGAYFDTKVVTGGPAHTYFVRASDGGPVTTDSNSVTVAPLATPCGPPPPAPFITGVAYCDPGDPQSAMEPAVLLQWTADYSTSYDVYQNGQFLGTVNGGATSLLSLVIFDDSFAGQTMTFYVVAKNAGGTSTSNTIELTVPADICSAAPPVPVLSGSAGCDYYTGVPAVQLDWTAVTEARGYQLFRNGVPYAMIRPLLALVYTDNVVVPGQTYRYNVATNGLSAPLSNTITATVPEGSCTPGPLVVTPRVVCNDNRTGVALTWTTSVNATSYTVTRDSSAMTSGITGNQFYDSIAVPGATYAYRVLGVHGTLSTPSAPVTVTVTDICPPSVFTVWADAFCDEAPSVDLSWDPSFHATSYTVSRDGTVVSGILPSTAHYYQDSTALGSHHYSVVASNASGQQTASTNVSITREDCGLVPGTFTATATGYCNEGAPAVSVTWSPADGANLYVVVRNGVMLGSAYVAYNDTNVVANQSYTYTILALNGYGHSSAQAEPITPSLGYCPPTSFPLTAATGCNPPVTLVWEAATTNVLSYSIIRDHVPIASVDSNMLTYADHSAQANASYEYFVRANVAGGLIDSNVVTPHAGHTCEGPAPDLAALVIKPSAMSGRVGDTIAVDVELVNLGNGTAKAATARVRFGRLPSMSSADTVLGTISLPALGSGEDITRTINVRLPNYETGTYYLFLSLDEEHGSGEVHRDDDVKASGAFSLTDLSSPRRRAATH
jgi:hypothetical protein